MTAALSLRTGRSMRRGSSLVVAGARWLMLRRPAAGDGRLSGSPRLLLSSGGGATAGWAPAAGSVSGLSPANVLPLGALAKICRLPGAFSVVTIGVAAVASMALSVMAVDGFSSDSGGCGARSRMRCLPTRPIARQEEKPEPAVPAVLRRQRRTHCRRRGPPSTRRLWLRPMAPRRAVRRRQTPPRHLARLWVPQGPVVPTRRSQRRIRNAGLRPRLQPRRWKLRLPYRRTIATALQPPAGERWDRG
jgi:hypothetical protein